MYVVTYILKSSGNIQKKLHIGNHEESMRNNSSSYSQIVSYEKNNDWKRIKIRNNMCGIVVLNRFTNEIVFNSFQGFVFLPSDIFFNKVEQLFCIGNDINKAYNMKKYMWRLVKIGCRLKKK